MNYYTKYIIKVLIPIIGFWYVINLPEESSKEPNHNYNDDKWVLLWLLSFPYQGIILGYLICNVF